MAVNSFRQDETITISNKNVILRLFSYMKKYKLQVVGVLLCMLVTVVIALINPLLIEEAIDGPIAHGNIPGLFKLGIIIVVIDVIYMLMVKIRIYAMSRISNHILMDIRQELYEHIQTLSFTFFDSRPTGKILARVIGDVNGLKEVLSNAVTTMIPELVTVVGVMIIMFLKDWRLTLAALCSLPFMAAAIIIVRKFAHERWMLRRQKSSNLNAFVHEDVAGISVVQSFSAEQETRNTFDTVNEDACQSFIDAVRISDTILPIANISWGFGSVIMYLVGVKYLGAPEVSVGLLVAFGSYISMFWNPIVNISNFYNQLVMNLSSAQRIFEIMDTKADVFDAKDVIELPEITGEVEFSHVSFTYDEGTEAETKVLNDVSLQVKPGETIALVGPTGAGKTTIVNLISRFYDIQKGTISVDGYDLKKVSIKSLRQQMGVMTQDNFIFKGTIRDNILYGKLDATEEEMIAAAKAVNAHDFIIKMEKGYDTELQEQGQGLSVGQRQLIAFARTMISQPRILILDEATSSIDTHTELLVQEGIAALLKGRTSFVIAHRLSTIQNADRIFVIDEGGIKECGTPAELLARKGAYYNLYMAQFADVI